MIKPDRGRLLILDNEPEIVRALDYQFKRKGYRCLTAIRSMEAMAHCTQNHVDLIITDLIMPGLDGEGFVSMVRSVSNVPIIVLTGCSASHWNSLISYGHLDVMGKPFEFVKLQKLVDQRLNRTTETRTERLSHVW